MGKKRKSQEPEAEITDENISKKRKKKHRRDKKNGTPVEPTQYPNCSNSTTELRLAQLERLTQELTCDLESTRKHLGEGGDEIVNTIAELSRGFSRAHLSKSNGSTESQSPAVTHEPGKHGLPPVPLIRDKSLENATFTHHGTIGQAQTTPTQEVSYDRLEVLGDAYLEVIATRLIWDQFKTLPAGQLSQARELLVKNETLAEYATKYGFDKRAKVPPDYTNQPKRWIKTKGDIFEAYVAAAVLSDPLHGFNMVEDWFTQLWLPKLKEFQPSDTVLTAKEELGKMVMGKGIKLRYVDESRPIRNGGLQTFFIGVYLTGWGWTDQHLGSGMGLNKVGAGNEAAKQALANKPLIDEIHAIKKAFDEKVRAEREKAGA